VKRAYVDANVIIRLITGDPPEMAERAERLFRQVDEGGVELVVSDIVIAETVWVLSSFYGFSAYQIGPALEAFLIHDHIVSDQKEELLRALALYEEHNLDFADALLSVLMVSSDVLDVYSFDKHFDRLASVNRIEPG
jgi:predicted nucleic acid-binding protein